jgi:uncharacterized membrane protein YkoI
MNLGIVTAFTVGLLSLTLSAQTPPQNAAPQKSNIPAALKSQAKIPLETARATALKKVPGVIKEEELEKENGKLVYSFDIQVTGQKGVTEVQVSAIDGSIVSVEKEDAAAEAKEQKQEAAKRKP